MFAHVYRCRHQGVLMDRQAIQAHPKSGELVVHQRGFNTRIAKLLAPDGETYLLPVLDKVKLLAVNDRGVLLSGLEVHPPKGLKGSGPIYQQTWWCVTHEVVQPAPEVLVNRPDPLEAARARELRREGDEVGRTMSMHSGRR